MPSTVREVTVVTALLLGLASWVVGCAGTDGPTEIPTDEFTDVIVPIFEENCSSRACHGADESAFAALNPTYFAFPVDADGRIRGEERIQAAFDRARETSRVSLLGKRFRTPPI